MSLYVVRLNVTNHVVDSRPCQNCYTRLTEYGIKRIIYSVSPTNYICVKLADYIPNGMSEGDEYYQTL